MPIPSAPFVPALFADLGVSLPLIQAPMAGVQGSRLAISVCQAGGIGSLPCAMLSLEQIHSEVTAIRDATDQPFNVNFFAHQHCDYTAAMQARWHTALQPYYAEFGLSDADISHSGARKPFDAQSAELICDLKVAMVSFHFGLPETALLDQVKASGAKILATATTVAEARWLEAQGVDAIIAQGLEAGGHRGMFLSQDLSTQSGTFSLVPNIVRSVSCPVIAAGGIADAATANAAFALGAQMLQVGSAFLLAEECDTKPWHLAALQESRAEHTALTNVFSGGVARGIVNRFIRETGGLHPDAPPFPHAAFVSNPIKAAAEAQGSDEFSSLWSGQNVTLASKGTAEDIIASLFGTA